MDVEQGGLSFEDFGEFRELAGVDSGFSGEEFGSEKSDGLGIEFDVSRLAGSWFKAAGFDGGEKQGGLSGVLLGEFVECWRGNGDLECAAVNDEWKIKDYRGRRISGVLWGGIEQQLDTAECGVEFVGAGVVAGFGSFGEDIDRVDGGELIDGFALEQEHAGSVCVIVLFIERIGGGDGVTKCLE